MLAPNARLRAAVTTPASHQAAAEQVAPSSPISETRGATSSPSPPEEKPHRPSVYLRPMLLVHRSALLAWMIYLNAFLAAVFMIVGPLIAVSVRYVSKRFRRISQRIQQSMGTVTHTTEEMIEGYRAVKAYGGKDFEAQHFHEVNEKNRRLQMKMVTTDAASVPLIQFISAAALSGIVYLASLQALKQQITPGDFISFITAMGMLLSPIKRLTSVNASIQRAIAAGQSIFGLLNTEAERDEGRVELSRARGELELRNVSLVYEAKKGEVLRNINLSIRAGDTVALVGRSGSGKSSLVNLIPRFYEPSSGAIFLDGYDLRDLTLESLRRQIAIVSQEITLFNETIRNNIAYGALRVCSDEQIIAAARAAHALDFIEALPDGFETRVGEGGVLLSGGQRQRVAIARAILKDAPLLILDEATSALDTESERHIQSALAQLMRQRTTLVIAHRLSTIEKADRIIVLQGGRIVEQGTHAELLRQGGHYHTLHRLQVRNAAPAALG